MISAVTCPCHLPITVPILLVLLAGTPTAFWITNHMGLIYAGMFFIFVLSLGLGFLWLEQPDTTNYEPNLGREM